MTSNMNSTKFKLADAFIYIFGFLFIITGMWDIFYFALFKQESYWKIMPLGIGLFFLAIGFGIFKKCLWARRLILYFAAISIVLFVIVFITRMPTRNNFIIPSAVDGVILIFFNLILMRQ